MRRTLKHRLPSMAVVIAVLLGGMTVAQGTAAAVATPTVTPIADSAGRGWAVSGSEGVIDLAARGYTEAEYLMSGQATTYEQEGTWTDNGVWNTRVATTGNPYTTRLVVVRPTNPAKFNGTVVVEWLNVSFGVDIPVDFSQSYEHFIREGYAYVGVTAQKIGADKLKAEDSARYSPVNLTNDTQSYDIFSQAAQAVRSRPELLGGRTPTVVLATGHSQSALRLTTYTNAVQPKDNVFNGIMLHGRASSAAAIGTGGSPPSPAKIRTDLSAPVFTIQSETDIAFSSGARQDTAKVRTWEVAGTAHADQYGLDLYNAANARDKSINNGAPTTCANPVNSMTFRYAQNAAYYYLNRWARGGAAPPDTADISTLLGLIVLRDADGNALGGVRLPDLDAPVAKYSPNNSGGNVLGACLLLGTTTPFTAARISQLYPDHATYVARFTAAANAARQGGYLLQPDYDEAVARAAAAGVP